MEKDKFVPRVAVGNRMEEIISHAAGKNVLHIGMDGFIDNDEITDGMIATGLTELLHYRISKVVKSVDGLDINPKMLDAMEKLVPGKYYLCSLTDPSLPEKIDSKYDLVVFGETLEHLDDFKSALGNIRHLLKEDGEMLLTTINAHCINRQIKLLASYESTHAEHTSFFSYLTLKRLLEMNGFKMTKFMFVNQKWESFNGTLDRLAYSFSALMTRFLPQYATQILCLATPAGTKSNDKQNLNA